MSDAPTRPRPLPTRNSAFFWEGVARHELLGQACRACGRFRHPPRPMCPSCHSLEWDARPLSGRGRLHAWIRPVHPPLPMFDEPPICVLVDLDEGIRLFSNLVGCEPSQIETGMPLEVGFEPTEGGGTVPVFRPARSEEA